MSLKQGSSRGCRTIVHGGVLAMCAQTTLMTQTRDPKQHYIHFYAFICMFTFYKCLYVFYMRLHVFIYAYVFACISMHLLCCFVAFLHALYVFYKFLIPTHLAKGHSRIVWISASGESPRCAKHIIRCVSK